MAAARTDCASMIPALGSASRPSRSRTFPRSRSWNSAISPCSRQRRKKARTRPPAGKSAGIARQEIPPAARQRIASGIWPVAVALGLPTPALKPGRQRQQGLPAAPFASALSDGYRRTRSGWSARVAVPVREAVTRPGRRGEGSGTGAYHNGNRASRRTSVRVRIPEPPRGPALTRVPPEDHPPRTPVRPARSKTG